MPSSDGRNLTDSELSAQVMFTSSDPLAVALAERLQRALEAIDGLTAELREARREKRHANS